MTYSSSPGTYILTGSADRTIRLYNPTPSTALPQIKSRIGSTPKPAVPEGRLIQTYSAHGYEVLSLDVSTSNETFVSSGGDRNVFLWDVASATTLRRFSGHTSRVNCVKFAGEGNSIVVSGGFDTTVRLWDVRSSSVKAVQVLEEAKDSITSLCVHGAEVVSGSVDGRVRSYDVRMGRMTTDVVGVSGVTSLWMTRDGNAVLVGGLDSKLRLMDREKGTCLKMYEDRGWKNEELRVQSALGWKEKYVIAGDEAGGKLVVWDVVTGRKVGEMDVPWPEGFEGKRVVGRDGTEKERSNVLSCLDWRDGGWGDQFCVGGTGGVVAVYAA